MKKILLFAASALMIGALAVSCDKQVKEEPYAGPVVGTSDWGLVGSVAESLVGVSWDQDALLAAEGDCFVIKNVKLAASDEFKIRYQQSWDVNRGGTFEALNAGFYVSQNGSNIVPKLDGIYDIWYKPASEQMAVCAKDTEPEWVVGTAAKILTFKLVSGETEIEGEIFDADKLVEVQYQPEYADLIKNAKAEYTISAGASVSPDPETITDWSSELKLTVTSEDGNATNEYTIKAIPIEYAVAIAPATGDGKTLVEIGANNDIAYFAGNQIAFCAVDKIATADGRVYDLDLNYVGDLNYGEIPSGCALTSMGNDDNGVLIAAVGYADNTFAGPGVDGDGVITWNYTGATRFYAWKDGYDKAPTLLYSNESFLSWMNVSGDVNGNMLITAKQQGNAGNHHLFHFENGVVNGAKWQWFNTGLGEIDRDRTLPSCAPSDGMNYLPATWRMGQTAGSTVCPLGVDKEEALFVYAQALTGLAEYDAEYSADKWGKDGSSGPIVGVRQGYTGNDLLLWGTACTINGKTPPHRYGGYYGWGNVCLTGNVKAFKYSGNVYAAIAGQDWNEPHVTVVDVTASTEGNTVALLATTGVAGGLVCPLSSVAYVYNPATDKGEIVTLYACDGREYTSFLRRYSLTRTKK